MALADALDRYFDAWNAHGLQGVVASLTVDGTYEDPTTGLTTIWTPERLDNFVLPAQGGSFHLSELDGQWL
jgi:hypothetical protein